MGFDRLHSDPSDSCPYSGAVSVRRFLLTVIDYVRIFLIRNVSSLGWPHERIMTADGRANEVVSFERKRRGFESSFRRSTCQLCIGRRPFSKSGVHRCFINQVGEPGASSL